jgi:hypothetical protein
VPRATSPTLPPPPRARERHGAGADAVSFVEEDFIADPRAAEQRVRPFGYTDAMDELLAAAGAVVSATAGVSTFEARLRGRVICSGWLIGHVRDNSRALSRRRPAVPPLARLPRGADLALRLAEAH